MTTTEENQGSSHMGLLFFVCCRVIDCFCWQTVRFSWDEVTTPHRWSTLLPLSKRTTKGSKERRGSWKRCRKLKHTDSLSISHKFGWSFPSTIPESWLQVVLHAHCFPFYPQGLRSGFVDWYILQTLSSKILKLTTPLSWTRFAMETWRTSNFKAT